MNAPLYRIGALGALAFVVAGCGGADEDHGFEGQAVSGTVTLGGQPLDSASIQFVPVNPGAPGEAATEIKEGKFSLPKERGPAAGSYKVKISTIVKGEADPTQAPGPPPKTKAHESIPKKYNSDTELEVEIKPGLINELKFDLDAK